ncbi:hypothetical protein EIP91_009763 [Steccherinum ochraceum]|uniref:Uncharacterized protein n=1 Tax=Steccherinum ochraceum TaxID=92696 RepID=A0A4V2MV10_9APHY|nr:hypothetical protein EIP91_009763 [Steccherinum ochraceum]
MNVTFDQAKSSYTLRGLRYVDTWRKFSRYLFNMHSAWIGSGDVNARTYSANGSRVHRIKVDEAHGLVITSQTTGGTTVSDLATDRVLWELSLDYVRSWAHVEYGNGFLIFDRFGEFKEVWRLTTECEGKEPSTIAPPDAHQHRQSDSSRKRYPSTDNRGHFTPWALLQSPEWGRAFRFVYPTLLVGSFHKAYTFDVESGKLLQTIENTQQIIDGNPLGEIHYVEVNEQHIFISGSIEMRVFSRADGRLVYNLSASHIPDVRRMRVDVPMEFLPFRQAKTQSIVLAQDSRETSLMRIGNPHYFVAVHVSGQDLVLLRDDAQILIIHDYPSAILGKRPLSDFAINVNIRHSQMSVPQVRAIYMAVDHGRAAVVTTAGVFVFTLNVLHHSPHLTSHLLPSHSPPPRLLSSHSLSSILPPILPITDTTSTPNATSTTSTSSSTNTDTISTFTSTLTNTNPSPDPDPLPVASLALAACKVHSLDNYSALDQVTCLQMTESKLFLAYHPECAPEDSGRVGEDGDGNEGGEEARDGNGIQSAGVEADGGAEDVAVQQLAMDEEEDPLIIPGDYPATANEVLVEDNDEDEDDWFDEDEDLVTEWEPDLRSVVCIDFSPRS